MKPSLDPAVLSQLFLDARSHNGFEPHTLTPDLLRRLYDLLKWGPTSMNSQPARFVFLSSPDARERLVPALMEGNVAKTRAAAVTVIVAMDSRFFDHLPTQFPAYDAKPMFEANPALAHQTAFRNSSLQGAYLMMAARSLGLDCGPMSGFDEAQVNQIFFPDGRYRVNFLCNLGIGRREALHPRGPRLGFDDVCQVL